MVLLIQFAIQSSQQYRVYMYQSNQQLSRVLVSKHRSVPAYEIGSITGGLRQSDLDTSQTDLALSGQFKPERLDTRLVISKLVQLGNIMYKVMSD